MSESATAAAPEAKASPESAKAKPAKRELTPGEQNLRRILEYVEANFDNIECIAIGMQAKPGKTFLYEEEGRTARTDYEFISVDTPHVKAPQAQAVGIHRTIAIEGLCNRMANSFIGMRPHVSCNHGMPEGLQEMRDLLRSIADG